MKTTAHYKGFHFKVKSKCKCTTLTKLTLGRTGGGGGGGLDAIRSKVFLNFFLEDKRSAPDVFSSCSFICRAHFERSSVIVSCYGYEI